MNWLLISVFFYFANGQQFDIPNENEEKGQDYWMNLMKSDIRKATEHVNNYNVAKNVIMFIGDGMGVTVTTAGRFYKGQKLGRSGEETVLSWEAFPHVAMMKTYNLDKQVPDSGATATAFFTGVKGNYYTLAVNGAVIQDDCEASLVPENKMPSILKWAQDAGKDTGFVTTTRATHATPAVLYSHSASRKWECDTDLSQEAKDAGCIDIAAQLIENSAGLNLNVIFAGGRKQLGAALPTDQDDSCSRADGRNLVDEWLSDKKSRNLSAKYVTNTQQFEDTDVKSVDHIIGIFSGGHQPYELDRDTTPEGTPSIKQLTEAAIRRLQRSNTGYYLMVEGGRIDHALHDTKAKYALEDLVAFDEAIESALKLVGDDEDTLIIVTADHSHVMTLNGYPLRGNNILGTIVDNDATDNMPYTTLMFTNGVGVNYTINGHDVTRRNLTNVDTTENNFISPALVPVPIGYETHGGEDVTVHAKGPMAHLFQKVHEQAYIAHVVGYAACIGPYKDDCGRQKRSGKQFPPSGSASFGSLNISLYLFSILISIFVHWH